jgi:HAD superfamily hydrolase (TIGR01549 family)
MKRLLDKFPVLLFDMGGTFVFDCDKFGMNEDFYRTYCFVGGKRLSSQEVTHLIRVCFDGMMRDYNNPDCYNNFLTLTEGFQRYAGPPKDELPFLEKVFAIHEFGTVSKPNAELLCRLARTHRLGLVSNIWSPKQLCLNEFERAGIGKIFSHSVFSSDFRWIKPSPFLFQEALREMKAPTHEILFVGDNIERDMKGAKNVGLATAWVTPLTNRHPSVDYVMSNIQELETYVI